MRLARCAALLLCILPVIPCEQALNDCGPDAEVCQNLAKSEAWRRKALFGMMHPEHMADVLAEVEAAKADNDPAVSIHAALAFWEFEPYMAAIEGKFNEYSGTTFKNKPFAVFADGKGGGFVFYSSGFGYTIGSKIGRGHISEIYDEYMTIKNAHTGDVETVMFNSLYLAGHLVDEKGIGMSRLEPMSPDRLKGWKKGK